MSVSHLLMFTQTKTSVNLKLGRFPRGPTLSFKVLKYSLMRQVRAVVARPVDIAQVYNFAPLVVLNNFLDASKSRKFLQIVTVTLQNMFPAIDVASVSLTQCKRVVLFHYHAEDDVISFRHYAIRTTPTGLSRSVKRIVQTRIPDLSRFTDVSEYVLGGGGGASDSEGEEPTVALPETAAAPAMSKRQRAKARAKARPGQNAVKLVEIGPRLELKASKIQAGLADGDVLYHAFGEQCAVCCVV